ncbi:hypothetical protein Enr13x_38420 [Stieleria neptunia]|uniref:PEP-CTERM protein-sorting domain-containing protein n=2 Tax=Stieleria neptunia TaxID=2527979 RepID=A0A518HT52_9BACT|nr:hypothetical protein Enr13x_38420 [Stieleria neptunia]
MSGPTPFRRIILVLFAAFFLFMSGRPVQAELTFTLLGETQTIDFQDYTGAGLASGGGGGALDSNDWELVIGDDNGSLQTSFGDTVGVGVFGRGMSSGGVSDSGYYSFETGGGNRALGIQLGDAGFSFGIPSLRIRNQTGQVVDALTVRYDVWVYNDSNNSNYFDLEFSNGSAFIDPVFLDTPSAADGTPEWVQTTLQYDLLLPENGLFGGVLQPLADGDSMLVEWSGGGSFDALNGFDEMAIDNIQITAFSTAIPEPGTPLALCVVSGVMALRRRRRKR